jgi:signal transduction histidine kinase/ActR/RegA family two-component response regulator
MTIGSKLLLSFMSIAFFVGIVGFVGVNVSNNTLTSFEQIAHETIPLIEALDDLKVGGLRIVASTSEYGFIRAEKEAADKNNPAKPTTEEEEEEERLINSGVSLYDDALKRFEQLLQIYHPEHEDFYTEIADSGQELQRISEKIITLKNHGVAGLEVLESKEDFEKIEKRFLNAVNIVLEHEHSALTAREEQTFKVISTATSRITWISILTFVLSVVIGVFISRAISKPIGKLKKMATKVGNGDLDARIEIKSKDEVGSLAASLNMMAEDLSKSIQKEKKLVAETAAASAIAETEKLKAAELQEALLSRDLETNQRKLAENEKRKMESQLQQAYKMEAIGTLAGGIAHDFNNILSAILGYADMAKDDAPEGSSIRHDLEKVLQAGNRAKKLVKQILAFSRQTDTECILFQPANIVKEAIKMLRPTIPATIDINQNINPKAGVIFADPSQVHQILMNLCTNAFHAMEETGGTLDISLKETELDKKDLVHEPGVGAKTFVQLTVKDTGPGIAPEIRDRIFDPYFTTKEVGKGTGMGLAIIHGIVKSYGGFISLVSEPGKGSAFHVYIPSVEKEVLPETTESEDIPRGKERILFIDDEEYIADMGKDMLERIGYSVTIRKSSLDALEKFQNKPDLFDLVITDQTMPGMTGVDLAKRMLLIRPDIPIILCTGYSTTISEEKAKTIGIKEFAYKPILTKDIAKLIRKVLDAS